MTRQSREFRVSHPLRSLLLGTALLLVSGGLSFAGEPSATIEATPRVSMVAGDAVGFAVFRAERPASVMELAHISVNLKRATQPDAPQVSTIDMLNLTNPARVEISLR